MSPRPEADDLIEVKRARAPGMHAGIFPVYLLPYVQRKLRRPTESALLFGPRGTGKSTWLAEVLPNAVTYDLLDTSLAMPLAREPSLLSRPLTAIDRRRWIVIDEIQKVPALLDEVHRQIEKERRRFVLSGSSARKLRRGAANLLAGRAVQLDMFPLVSAEVGAVPPLDRLAFGKRLGPRADEYR